MGYRCSLTVSGPLESRAVAELEDQPPQFGLVQVCCLGEPPHLNWSTVMFRRRRTRNGEQAAQAGGNSSEAAAG